MKKIWGKYKEYIIIFVYGVVVFALFYFVVMPMIRNVDRSANLIQEKMADQDSYRKRLGSLSINESQVKGIETNEGKLNVLLPKDQEVMLIEKMEKIAEETNNKISIEAVEDKNSATGVKTKTATSKEKEEIESGFKINTDSSEVVRFKITILGKYNDLVNFIQKIENMEYWSDILSLQVSYKEPGKPEKLAESSVGLIGELAGSESEKPLVIIDESDTSSVLEIIFYLAK